jgi:hypothetical protein
MLALSLLGWFGAWVLWFTLTRDFHPTLTLAVIVTTSLVVAYAAAAYINHLVLIPRFWATGRPIWYVFSLSMMMALLTAAALAVIRTSYFQLWGPDPDPNGAYKHFAIDLFGMAVHLLLAAGVVMVARRFAGPLSSAGATASPQRSGTDKDKERE